MGALQKIFSLKFFPWLILCLGLTLTFNLWRSYQTDARHDLDVEFQIISDRLSDAILQRLKSNEQVLRGVVGLFNSSQDVSREEFKNYVQALQLEDRFPGIQGVAFSKLLQPADLSAHVAEIRRQGHANYSIRPEGARDLYTSIIYVEPFAGRNLRAFGFDMYAEPVRQAAMQRARDEGVAAMSGRVTLVQETKDDVQQGFLIYLPVYRNNMPHATLEERRANLLGWAYSPLRINDMMNGVLSQVDFAGIKPLVNFEIFAAEHASESSLMFDSDGKSSSSKHALSAFSSELKFTFGGNVWSVRIFSLPGFEAHLDQKHSYLIALAGVAFSVLLALYAFAQRQVVISLYKTAEANRALVNSKERYQTLFSSMAEGVFYQQADGTITDANAAALGLFGVTRDELLGRTSMNPDWRVIDESGEVLAPENHPSMFALRTGQAVINKVVGVFNPIRHSIVWLGISAIPQFLDGESVPYQVFVTMFDLSERKAAEEKLRVMVAAIEQSSNAIEITNADAVIEYVNPAFLKSVGRSYEAVIGQNPRIFASGQTPQATYEAMWRQLSAGQSWTGEFINKRPGGVVYIEHASIAPIIQSDGRISHFIAIKEDVTELKRTEAELARYREHLEELVEARTADLSVAKEAAEAASRAKSTFLATMSHELRTPMNAIIGLSYMLSRKSVDGEQRDKLGKISASANDLLKILSNVLDLSKIDAERMTLDPVPFSLISVFNNIDNLLGHEAQAKGILLGYEIPPEHLGVQLFGDAMKLQQVLLELLSNAIKFTERGNVSLSVNVQDVRDKVLLVRFSVADTGIGIARADWSRLFNPFEQLDGSMTRRFGGTGLGLALAKRIVQLLGGEIGLESEPGKGTTFWFTSKFERFEGNETQAAVQMSESRDELLVRLDKLRDLLANDDMASGKAYLSLKPSIEYISSSTAEHLGRQIEDFAFDEALGTLEELMRTIQHMPTTH